MDQSYEDLLSKRKIHLGDRISDQDAQRIGKAIIVLNARDDKEPIDVHISSEGGDIYAGLDICDAFLRSKALIVGTVYRAASSTAAVVLQACSERLMVSNAEIRLHLPQARRVDLHLSDAEILRVLAPHREKQRRMYELLAMRTKRSFEEIAQWCVEARRFDAGEALKWGLIDKVI